MQNPGTLGAKLVAQSTPLPIAQEKDAMFVQQKLYSVSPSLGKEQVLRSPPANQSQRQSVTQAVQEVGKEELGSCFLSPET